MNQQPDHDLEQLRLLSIFHYVAAGLTALFSLFPLLHVAFGAMFIVASKTHPRTGEPPPEFIGWTFVVMGTVIIILGLTLAVLILMAGRSLAQRRRYTFCLVVAGLECLNMPIGTALGVFTIIVLQRDSVRRLFGHQPAARAE